jgi:hypothetical protein
MNVRNLKDQFARIGARVMVESARELWQARCAAQLDIRKDHRGEYFHLMIDALRVISIEARDSQFSRGQIELIVRQRNFGSMSEAPRQRFLCNRVGRALCAIEIADAMLN